jgi:hypothetical protein
VYERPARLRHRAPHAQLIGDPSTCAVTGTSRGFFITTALVVTATAADVLLLDRGPHGVAGVALVALATLASMAVGYVSSAVPTGALLAACALLAGCALTRAPGSHDLYSYDMYGRMVEHYRADPYVVLPNHFTGDAVLRAVQWRHAPSAYGPAFVGVAAVVAAIAGTDLFAVRLGFQVLAAAAAVGSALVVARVAPDGTRRAAMLLLNPLLWAVVVNGGHNDMLVGAALRVAFVLVDRRHPGAGGAVAALAAATKLPALAPAAGIALIATTRHRVRDAVAFCVACIALLAVASGPWPQWPGAALRATRGLTTRATPWTWLRTRHRAAGVALTHDALVLVVLVAVVVVVWFVAHARHGHEPGDPAVLVAALAAAYTVGAAYVLPWYAMWALPVAALARDRRIFVWSLAQAAWLTACYQLGGRADTTTTLARALLFVGPVVVLVVFVFVVLTSEPGRETAGAIAPAVREDVNFG